MQADTLYQAYQGAWRRVLDRLRLEVDDDAFKFWLQDLELQQAKGGNLHVTLIAPTLALQYWATTHYADRLLALWQADDERVSRIAIAAHSTVEDEEFGRMTL